MTHEEREALIERMVLAGINARRALASMPLRERLLQENPSEAAAMRAALDVAEQAIREDEREWLAQRHDESAAVSSDPNMRSLHKQMAGELRARGTQ